MIIRALVSFGVDDVLLQRQRTIRLWQTSAFWVSMGLSVVGMMLMVAVAPLGAALYHSPKLIGLVAVIAIAMPLGALSTVSSVTIRSQMGFRYLALYNTFEIAATNLLTIMLAWLGFGAYSFAIPLPILMAIKAVLFWSKAPPNLRSRLRLSQIKYLANKGSTVFGTKILLESVAQADYLTLGILASHSIVGSYYFAYRLAFQPLRMLAGNFSSVLFPAFAQLNAEPRRQLAAAINASRLLAYIAMPLCFLQAAAAGPFLRLWFGPKWLSAIPLVQGLSIGFPFDAISWIAGAMMSAQGVFRRQFVLTAALAPLFFALVVAGAFYASALGVAWGVTIYYIVTGPLYAAVAFGRVGASLRQVLSFYVTPPLVAGFTIGAAYLLAEAPALNHGSDLVRLVILGAAAPTLYVAVVRVVAPSVLTQLGERLGVHKLRRRFGVGLQHTS